MINHTIALDMRKRPGRVPPRLTLRRGESQTQKVTATLTDGGAAYTPTYQSARLCVLHAGGTWSRVAATVGTASVTATLPSEALNGAGRCRLAYFEFYSSNGYSETTENIELVILGNVDGTTDPAKSYDDELDALYKRMSAYQEAAETAEQERVSAETARVTAESARVTAEKTRATAESARATAENARATAETSRVANEKARETAESARATAENARATAETTRASASAKAVEDCSAAAADAIKAAEEARGAVSVDLQIYFKRVTDAQGNTRPVLVDLTA